jgi:hypothetical protein
MPVLIRSAVDAQLVRPDGTVKWIIEVADETGEGRRGAQLTVSTTGEVKPKQKQLRTDNQSKDS